VSPAALRAIAAASLVVLAASFLLTPDTLPPFTICPMMRFFDVPCPGCGLTRAFIAIAHGRFEDAWSLNPFSYLFFVLALALAWRPRWIARAPRAWAAGLLAATMWIWDVARILEVGKL
jgi:uncharacterized protein DUF2752